METRLTALLLALSMMLGLVSCGGQPVGEETSPATSQTPVESNGVEADNHYPVTVETYDQNGEIVEQTFEACPERVVSISQANTELLIALGLTDKIVATAHRFSPVYERMADEYNSIPFIAESGYPSKEVVLDQKPDLIVGWGSLFAEDALGAVNDWHERGVHTYLMNNRHAEGVVADFYAVDCVKRRVFNSDGGTWLQRNMVPGCTYQLDLFHRNRAVRTCVNDPDLQETILELFHTRKVKEAIAVVEASIESTLDPDEQEKQRKLFTYFNNYRKSLIPYYQRSGRKPPLPNEGQQPARCGSMESNIFTIIGNRMKHNRTCWSVAGANNLAALLALHRTGHLRRVLRDWTAHGAPSKLYTITAPISAKQTNKQMSEIYIPPHLLSAGDLHPAAKYCLTKFFPLSEMHTTE